MLLNHPGNVADIGGAHFFRTSKAFFISSYHLYTRHIFAKTQTLFIIYLNEIILIEKSQQKLGGKWDYVFY